MTTEPLNVRYFYGSYLYLKEARALRNLMRTQGVSARRLKEEAGLNSNSYMSALLSGERVTLRTEAAEAMAAYLGVNVWKLFTSTPPTEWKKK